MSSRKIKKSAKEDAIEDRATVPIQFGLTDQEHGLVQTLFAEHLHPVVRELARQIIRREIPNERAIVISAAALDYARRALRGAFTVIADVPRRSHSD